MSTNKEKIDQLTISFKNKDIGAAEELAQLGDDGVKVLVHGLEDTTADKEVRIEAAMAIGTATTYVEPSIAAMKRILRANEEEAIQLATIRALRQKGKEASPVFSELIHIVEEQETELTAEAIAALGALELTEDQTERTISLLVKALKKPKKKNASDLERDIESMIKGNSANALSQIGKPAVDNLIPLLTDDNESVAIHSAFILAIIGPDAQEAIPKLRLLLNDNNPKRKLVGAITLAQLESEREKVLPILILNLTSETKAVRTITAKAIIKLAPDAIAIDSDLKKQVYDIINNDDTLVNHNDISCFMCKALSKPCPTYCEQTAQEEH